MYVYDDMWDAYDEAVRRNVKAGKRDFTFTTTVDGGWAVRRLVTCDPPLDSAFVEFKNWLRQYMYGLPNVVVKP